MCRKTKRFCYCCARDLGMFYNPKYCNKMKHYLTTTDGDSLCWVWTVRAILKKYDCCFACEKRGCHYRALFKNGSTCQPKMKNLFKKKRESL